MGECRVAHNPPRPPEGAGETKSAPRSPQERPKTAQYRPQDQVFIEKDVEKGTEEDSKPGNSLNGRTSTNELRRTSSDERAPTNELRRTNFGRTNFDGRTSTNYFRQMNLDERNPTNFHEQISTDELRRMNFGEQMCLTNVLKQCD